MSEEVLAAAAVYMFSTYNNYLNVVLKTQNKTISNYKVRKSKELKKRYRMISANRNKARQNMNLQMLELLAEPSGQFWSYVRMSSIDFEQLLQKIWQYNTRRDIRWNASIPLKIRLALTLRYLATGESFESLNSLFKISTSIISRIIPEVCMAINEVLKDLIKIPINAEEWLSKTEGFNFPHCLGVLDGKHVIISPPCHARFGEDYKRCFSIVVLTLVDSDYCFISADVGPRDRASGDDELNQTALWQKISRNKLNLPTSSPLPGGETNMPYVFLGDEAFPLSKHVMIPFDNHTVGTPESAFNEQLKSSRVVVENAFGILSAVFRVLRNPLPLDAEKSSIITRSCILLHNYLRKSETSRDIYSPPGSVDTYASNELVSQGNWRNNSQNSFIQFQPLSRRTEDENAFQTRLDFMNYLFGNIKAET